MDDVRASFASAESELDPSRRLAALLRAASAIVKEHRDFWALSYGVRMQRDVLESLGPAVATWMQEILRTLERYLREAGWEEPALEAALLFAQIDGVHQHYVLDPEHYPIDAIIEHLVARYSRPPRSSSRDSSLRRSPARRSSSRHSSFRTRSKPA